MTYLLAATLAALTHTPSPAHAATPAQRVAVKALAGDYGKLAGWQVKGYRAILRGQYTYTGYAYLTSYGPWDPPAVFGGPYAADRGMRLTEAHCAADKGLPFGTLVWADGSLRIVRDRGGAVTVAQAKRRGHSRNDRNLDFYTKSRDRHFARSTVYVVAGRWDPTRAEVAR